MLMYCVVSRKGPTSFFKNYKAENKETEWVLHNTSTKPTHTHNIVFCLTFQSMWLEAVLFFLLIHSASCASYTNILQQTFFQHLKATQRRKGEFNWDWTRNEKHSVFRSTGKKFAFCCLVFFMESEICAVHRHAQCTK